MSSFAPRLARNLAAVYKFRVVDREPQMNCLRRKIINKCRPSAACKSGLVVAVALSQFKRSGAAREPDAKRASKRVGAARNFVRGTKVLRSKLTGRPEDVLCIQIEILARSCLESSMATQWRLACRA